MHILNHADTSADVVPVRSVLRGWLNGKSAERAGAVAEVARNGRGWAEGPNAADTQITEPPLLSDSPSPSPVATVPRSLYPPTRPPTPALATSQPVDHPNTHPNACPPLPTLSRPTHLHPLYHPPTDQPTDRPEPPLTSVRYS